MTWPNEPKASRAREGSAAWITVAATIVLVVLGYLGVAVAAHWWPFGTASSKAAGSHSEQQATSPVAPRSGWSVYWSGPVGITGNGLNFDNKPPSSTSADIFYNGSLTSTDTATMATWTGPGTPTAAKCQSWVTTHPSSIIGTITTGMQICLLTSQHRAVLLDVQNLPSGAAPDLEAQATIWQQDSLLSSPSSSKSAKAAGNRWNVYWSGPVGITGNGINFDDKPPSSTSADIFYNGSLTSTDAATMATWTGPGTPTAAKCQVWVTTHPSSIIGTITTGMQICLLTIQGRAVLLDVQSLPSGAAPDLQAHATIWQQP